jgi:hypothetical protein
MSILVFGEAFCVERPECEERMYQPAPKTDITALRGFKGISIGDVKEFGVYLDKDHKDNHYIASGWIGDFGDIKMNDAFGENAQSGKNCLQFIYSAKKTQMQGWAGVYWQNPANNWGKTKGGYNLSPMNKISFWAKGAKGGETIQKFMVGGIKGEYPDSTSIEIGPITLTNTWTEYTINLAGKDLSYINGGFGWVTTVDLNPEGCTFYLDEIKFENDPTLKPGLRAEQPMPLYVYGDRTYLNRFIPSGWMGDYGDLKYDAGWRGNPHSGDTCIRIDYCGCAYQGARWAGIYWQNPPNNWGNVDAGYNLSRATKLTFWARGEKGGERVDDFKVGGIGGEFTDSSMSNTGPVVLNKEWTQYTIDLKGQDLTYIIGGFCFTANIDQNPNGMVMYLDDIKFE